MFWAFKMFFKIIGYIIYACFVIPFAIIGLPFYLLLCLFGLKPKIDTKKSKHKDDSWVDRIEEYDAFMN